MTSNVETIYTNCKVIIQATLGSTYSELSHCYDIPRNSFEQAVKRWGLIVERSPEAIGETRHATTDIYFSLILTDEHGSVEETDSEVRSKVVEMFGKFELIWKDLIQQKAGGGPVRLVSGFSIERAAIIEQTRIIEVLGQFFIRASILV